MSEGNNPWLNVSQTSASTNDSSSIISQYIQRFRYAKPTPPNDPSRKLPTEQKAFWWLEGEERHSLDASSEIINRLPLESNEYTFSVPEKQEDTSIKQTNSSNRVQVSQDESIQTGQDDIIEYNEHNHDASDEELENNISDQEYEHNPAEEPSDTGSNEGSDERFDVGSDEEEAEKEENKPYRHRFLPQNSQENIPSPSISQSSWRETYENLRLSLASAISNQENHELSLSQDLSKELNKQEIDLSSSLIDFLNNSKTRQQQVDTSMSLDEETFENIAKQADALLASYRLENQMIYELNAAKQSKQMNQQMSSSVSPSASSAASSVVSPSISFRSRNYLSDSQDSLPPPPPPPLPPLESDEETTTTFNKQTPSSSALIQPTSQYNSQYNSQYIPSNNSLNSPSNKSPTASQTTNSPDEELSNIRARIFQTLQHLEMASISPFVATGIATNDSSLPSNSSSSTNQNSLSPMSLPPLTNPLTFESTNTTSPIKDSFTFLSPSSASGISPQQTPQQTPHKTTYSPAGTNQSTTSSVFWNLSPSNSTIVSELDTHDREEIEEHEHFSNQKHEEDFNKSNNNLSLDISQNISQNYSQYYSFNNSQDLSHNTLSPTHELNNIKQTIQTLLSQAQHTSPSSSSSSRSLHSSNSHSSQSYSYSEPSHLSYFLIADPPSGPQTLDSLGSNFPNLSSQQTTNYQSMKQPSKQWNKQTIQPYLSDNIVKQLWSRLQELTYELDQLN